MRAFMRSSTAAHILAPESYHESLKLMAQRHDSWNGFGATACGQHPAHKQADYREQEKENTQRDLE